MPFQASEPDLITRIPLSARTILVIGSTSSHLIAAYRTMNPKVRVLQVDVAAIKKELVVRHAGADGRTQPSATAGSAEDVDCIIYDECPHHPLDPRVVIRHYVERLGLSGTMLLRVQNTGGWLSSGSHSDDQQSDDPDGEGFLGSKTIQDYAARAGLTVCGAPPYGTTSCQTPHRAGTASAKGASQDDYPNVAGYKIWQLCRQPREPLIVHGSMLDPVGGVSHLRVIYPFQAIATDPAVTAHVTDHVGRQAPSDDAARIFILHRPTLCGPAGQQIIYRLTNAGFLVVTEFDDLPSHFEMMQLGGELSFYGVHALQTSTAAMAEALRQYHAEIAVFPNAIPALPPISNFNDMKVMTLFFGALNRQKDWLPLMPAINAVAAMAGSRLKFAVVHDQSFFDALETPYKSFTPTCDHETYLHLLGNSEIAFMPLADTAFNRAKSDLKFIEAGACRVAALASSVVYGDSVRDGHNGALFRDPVDFHVQLLRLIAIPELTRDLADAARQYVSDERMLAYQVKDRIGWYRSLWARRSALDAARQGRMAHYSATAIPA